MKLLNYLGELFFPSTCIYCGASVPDAQTIFCPDCLLLSVFTNFQTGWNNEMTDRLISIQNIKNAYAPLFYKKNAPIAGLFYKIKYGNRPDLAQKFGSFLGKSLHQIPKTGRDIDIICYVPVHPIKKARRGYNQSEIIAQSVGESLKIPTLPLLSRLTNIDTQTHYGRMDRLKNQEGSIRCDSKVNLFNHVLIVDDILTTGATMEICYDAIRQVAPKVDISVATLALTDNW
ncbi:MAG: ComF family protein [Saprospiraceae bacterium]|nr:ComF family protein [Saprospiraceae bacterium]